MGTINKSSKAYIKTQAQANKALADIGKNIEAAIAGIGLVTEDVLHEVGLNIMVGSNNIAPIDTGELVESSYTITETSGSTITTEVGYKDSKAVFQHELYGTSYKNPTTPDTSPKFLATAANEVESEIGQIVADAIRNQLGTK